MTKLRIGRLSASRDKFARRPNGKACVPVTVQQTEGTLLDKTLATAVRLVVPCAVVPLAFGLIAFVGWLVCYLTFRPEREIWFVILGVGATALGCLGLLFGAAILVRQIYLARKLATGEQTRRVLMHAGFLSTLLILDVFVAFFVGTVAAGMYSSTALRVDNQSGKALRKITLLSLSLPDGEPAEAAGEVTEQIKEEFELGTVFNGKTGRFRFRASTEYIRVVAVWDDEEVELYEYRGSLAPGTASRFRVTFNGPDSMTVLHGSGAATVAPTPVVPTLAEPAAVD